ncbi:type II toxin-antitoxin system RelE/ParE family toxin [Mucilaginibacter psychrotolerans]|uniref:Type II toxin-antitoxin system RelE/ParE family toxin n=1 Tax=Mucilaginibacter psychrotolerans TaxID=1524096 RepID=A0A4Y8SGZ0_9SPHI|nr:type II toxin-antitoxin system RelE/ParE family toxin [Mucilaginibacter psychrotolerans]
MAYKIVWTKQAINGFDKVVSYLIENWTEKELREFISETDRFFEILAQFPEILQRTATKENVRRGPINKLTVITYRLKRVTKQIEIISFRSARQKPLKRYPPL